MSGRCGAGGEALRLADNPPDLRRNPLRRMTYGARKGCRAYFVITGWRRIAAPGRSKERTQTMISLRNFVIALVAAVAALTAVPASAGCAPNTRLVQCDSGNCLLISGYRSNPASEVRINGRVVAVEGKRNWRARVPVETVRTWSAPFARSIEISLQYSGQDTGTAEISVARADLPIGLMGHTDLAMLIVGID